MSLKSPIGRLDMSSCLRDKAVTMIDWLAIENLDNLQHVLSCLYEVTQMTNISSVVWNNGNAYRVKASWELENMGSIVTINNSTQLTETYSAIASI